MADDYAGDAQEAMDNNNKVYSIEVMNSLKAMGIETSQLVACTGSQDTVIDCPSKNHSLSEFIMVAHNPNSQTISQFLRTKLVSNKYKAMVWDKKENIFVDTKEYDILEQVHWKNDTKSKQTKEFTEYEMFVQQDLQPNEISFVKIVKTQAARETELKNATGSKLEITGFDEFNEALFNFTNGGLNQSFGVTLKHYKAKQVQKDLRQDYKPGDFMEGAYLFVPEGNKSY